MTFSSFQIFPNEKLLTRKSWKIDYEIENVFCFEADKKNVFEEVIFLANAKKRSIGQTQKSVQSSRNGTNP
jgi:hypothetical protein